jgi:uncharacterized protein YndB with AHSA1/START domain
MKPQKISASAVVKAPAGIVYAILADYRTGHPNILPRQFFPFLEVLQGGVGAGTRIRFQMRVGGATRTFQAEVSEPEPGRLLAESNYDEKDPSLKSVTTFRLEPTEEGKNTDVTITTEMTLHAGLTGVMEGLFAPAMIRSVYQQELRNLASVAEARATAT